MQTPTICLSLPIQQGATFRPSWKRFQVPGDAVARNGVLVYRATGKAVPPEDMQPVDYTGASARMQVRKEVGAPEVLLTFSTTPQDGEGGITLGADGTVELHLSAAQTSALPHGCGPGQWTEGVGQMEVTFANGDVLRHFEISLYLDPEGTRD